MVGFCEQCFQWPDNDDLRRKNDLRHRNMTEQVTSGTGIALSLFILVCKLYASNDMQGLLPAIVLSLSAFQQ